MRVGHASTLTCHVTWLARTGTILPGAEMRQKHPERRARREQCSSSPSPQGAATFHTLSPSPLRQPAHPGSPMPRPEPPLRAQPPASAWTPRCCRGHGCVPAQAPRRRTPPVAATHGHNAGGPQLPPPERLTAARGLPAQLACSTRPCPLRGPQSRHCDSLPRTVMHVLHVCTWSDEPSPHSGAPVLRISVPTLTPWRLRRRHPQPQSPLLIAAAHGDCSWHPHRAAAKLVLHCARLQLQPRGVAAVPDQRGARLTAARPHCCHSGCSTTTCT